MATNEAGNGSKLSGRQTFIIAILSAVLGGAGGPVLLANLFPDSVRPDPFTGAQGKTLERRITALERHVGNHPDALNKYDRRITILETRLIVIIGNQERILDSLERSRRE